MVNVEIGSMSVHQRERLEDPPCGSLCGMGSSSLSTWLILTFLSNITTQGRPTPVTPGSQLPAVVLVVLYFFPGALVWVALNDCRL